jgi:serine protease Do
MLRKISKIALLLSLSCSQICFGETPPCNPCDISPRQISKAFTNVAKKATPAVVFIKVEFSDDECEEAQTPFSSPFDQFGDDFFNRFFGGPRGRGGQRRPPQINQGSGFIVTPDGYIVTNAHVVRNAIKITVVLNDGSELDANLVGEDPNTDIAIIKVHGENLPFIAFGDSEDMDIGEWVIAIGSPFQLEASVTVGVISAKGRQNLKITDLEDFIQTDAAINPGNSGGPLINLDGDVIGINTAIVSRSGGYMGIGFAIPSNMAKVIMDQLISKGCVSRGYLGIAMMQPVDKDIADAFNLEKAEGVLISEIVKGSPADKAGLKQGDIVLELNRMPVKSIGGFRKDISMMEPGTKVDLKVNRKGEVIIIPVTLGNAATDIANNSGITQKLGFEVSELTPDLAKRLGYSGNEEAVVITKIKPGSVSAQAGLRPGFLVVAVNHKKVKNLEEFNEIIAEMGNKKRLLLLARQGNFTRFYSLKAE